MEEDEQIIINALNQIKDDAASEEKQLEHCLSIIDNVCQNDGQPASDEPLSDQAWWWRSHRLLVLQRYDRLKTLLELQSGQYNVEAYTQLCRTDVSAAASSAAACGNLATCLVLLHRHPYSLGPNLLTSLYHTPDTLPSKAYEPILRCLANFQPDIDAFRPPDWVEVPATLTELHRRRGTNDLASVTEHLARLENTNPIPSKDEIVQWVARKAAAIDRSSGQLQMAISLLAVGRDVFPEADSLAELQMVASQLLQLIKLDASQGYNEWAMPLESWANMDAGARIQAFFRHIHLDSMPQDVQKILLPVLQSQINDRNQTLIHALEREAQRGDDRLSWVVEFLTIECELPVAFENHAQVLKAACAVAYALPAVDTDSDNWESIDTLISCGTAALDQLHDLDPSQIQALNETLLQLEGHVIAARLFTTHGLPTSPAEIRSWDRQHALVSLQTLLGRAGRTIGNKDNRWVELWMDLKTAQERGLPMLNLAGIREGYCRALLSVGRFKLVGSYLAQLPVEQQEELVLTAARDRYQSVGAPDEASLAAAVACLRLLPENKAAKQEAAYVDALSTLWELGVEIVPAQLQQSPQPATLLKDALFRSLDEVLHDIAAISQAVAVLAGAEQGRHIVLEIASEALKHGDFDAAKDVAINFINDKQGSAWDLASQVALDPRCPRDENQLALLSYSLRHGPANNAAALLTGWKENDAERDSMLVRSFIDPWITPGEEHDIAGQSCEDLLLLHLNQNFGQIGGKSRQDISGCMPAMLASVLALGPNILIEQYEGMVMGQQGLSVAEKKDALMLGATACALLALQPSLQAAAGDPSTAHQYLYTPPETLVTHLVKLAASTPDNPTLVSLSQTAVSFCSASQVLEDTARASVLLHGAQAVGDLSSNVDPDSRRNLILQLAQSAAGKVNESSETALNELNEALAMAERYGVMQEDVKLQFAVAFLTSNATRGSWEVVLPDDIWESVLMAENKASEAFVALLERVYPLIGGRDIEGLSTVLNLASACCTAFGTINGDDKDWDGASNMLLSLADAATALSSTSPNITIKLFVDTAIYTLQQSVIALKNANDNESSTTLVGCPVLYNEIYQHVSLQATAGAAHAVDGLAAAINGLYQALKVAPTTVENNTLVAGTDVYLIVLCRELPESLKTGTSDAIEALKRGTKPTDLLSVAQWMLFHGSCPVVGVQALQPSMQTPPPRLALPLIRSILDILDTTTSSKPESQESIATVEGLENSSLSIKRKLLCEKDKLTGFIALQDETSLSEAQIAGFMDLISQIQQNDIGNVDVEDTWAALCTRLSELLYEGCQFTDMAKSGAICLVSLDCFKDVASVHQPNKIAVGAVRLAIEGSLRTLAGAGQTGASVGDAIQNLYGAVRSLSSPEEDAGKEWDAALNEARLVVWEAMQTFVEEHNTAGDAASAEAHLQVLEILGALGTSLWPNWQPPADALASSAARRDAVIFTKCAAALAVDWPGALQVATIQPTELTTPEAAEGSVLRLLSHAEDVQQLGGVATMLDVLSEHFPPIYDVDTGFNVSPLHRCWAACLRDLLSRGHLLPALRWLDKADMAAAVSSSTPISTTPPPATPATIEEDANTAVALGNNNNNTNTNTNIKNTTAGVLINQEEAESLVNAADDTLGVVASTTIGLLMPYPAVKAAAWRCLVTTGEGLQLADLPGSRQLAIVVLRANLLGDLHPTMPLLQRQLCLALLRTESEAHDGHAAPKTVASWWDLELVVGGIAPLRSVLVAAAAAALVQGGAYSTAGWLALQHAGTHRLLAMMDSGPPALRRLLQMGSSIPPLDADQGLQFFSGNAAVEEGLAVLRCAEVVVSTAGDVCKEALNTFETEMKR